MLHHRHQNVSKDVRTITFFFVKWQSKFHCKEKWLFWISSTNHKFLLSRKSTFLQVPEEEDSAGLAEDNFDSHVVPKTLQRRATRSVAAAIPFQVRKFVTDLWPIVNENFCLASDVKMVRTKNVTSALKIKLAPCFFLFELLHNGAWPQHM